MPALLIHKHFLILSVPLVAQYYPFKKWVIDKLQNDPRVHIWLVLVLGILHPDLVCQLEKFFFVLADVDHEFYEEAAEHLSTVFEIGLLAFGLFEVDETVEFVDEGNDFFDDAAEEVLGVHQFYFLDGGLDLVADFAEGSG